ncbi:uncharacterized protein [Diabrotica undecimpunctata]|uniref:uncharacterized protein isoform X1 n=1 Tax=Diabrotica undecimpunctata TaxID=50387 RepID=UPI003B6361F8
MLKVTNLFGGEKMASGEKRELGLQLQKRWKGIRSCYAREIKRQKSIKSGSGAEQKSEYIYFKKLQFLQREVAVRDTRDEMDGTVGNNGEDPIADRSQKQTAKKRNRDAATGDDDPFITALNKSIETRERRDNNENDEDRLFSLSLLSTLLDVVPRERKICKKFRLMSVLQEAVEDKTFNSYKPNTQYAYSAVHCYYFYAKLHKPSISPTNIFSHRR